MNSPQIKKLDIDRPPKTFLESLKEELKSLDSLTVSPRHHKWKFDQLASIDGEVEEEWWLRDVSFIASLPLLQSFSINGLTGALNLTAILNMHRQCLKESSAA